MFLAGAVRHFFGFLAAVLAANAASNMFIGRDAVFRAMPPVLV
jgi:hypothetical protein